MEELRKAQASGSGTVSGNSMILPVDANGSNIEDIMKEIAGNVLQEAMPDLMHQMGASERNPIMQASAGEYNFLTSVQLCLEMLPRPGLTTETDWLTALSSCYASCYVSCCVY